MQDILEYLQANWIGVGLGVIALLYALYEGTKKRGPRLAFQHIGSRLIGESADLLPDELEVTYAGSVVKNLSLTRIVIWNSGRSPLRNSDVPATDRIKIYFQDESEILRAEVTQVTRDVNALSIEVDSVNRKYVEVRFDFMDPGDGSLISVWHTSQKTAPKLSGTVIGQKNGPMSYGRFVWRGESSSKFERNNAKIVRAIDKISSSPVIMSLLIMTLSLSMILDALFKYYAGCDIFPKSDGEFKRFWMPLVLGSLNFLAGVWLLNRVRRRFPRKLLPDDYQPQKADAEVLTNF